jgi:hypothetical protein
MVNPPCFKQIIHLDFPAGCFLGQVSNRRQYNAWFVFSLTTLRKPRKVPAC